jgi:hypothetical protein
VANQVMDDLLRTHGPVGNVPDEALRNGVADVVRESWAILKNWKGPHLE